MHCIQKDEVKLELQDFEARILEKNRSARKTLSPCWEGNGKECQTFLSELPVLKPEEATRTETYLLNVQRAGNTGTWHGPAPRGAIKTSAPSEVEATHRASIPSFVLLPGAAKMPLMGFGTDKIFSEEVFK